MKKLLFFTLTALISLGMSAQRPAKHQQGINKKTQFVVNIDSLTDEEYGKLNGYGVINYSESDEEGTFKKYVGNVVNGAFEGMGKLQFYNNEFYIGNFKSNKFHGVGTFFDNENEYYTGNWKFDRLVEVTEEGTWSITPNKSIKKEVVQRYDPPKYIGEENKTEVLAPIVIFAKGSSQIDAAGMASIEMIAKHMKKVPESMVFIIGYTYPTGDEGQDEKLSQARAEAVMKVLVEEYGIDESRMAAEGLGGTKELSEEPLFNNVVKFSEIISK